MDTIGTAVDWTEISYDLYLKQVIAKKYNLPESAVHLEMLDFFFIVANGAGKYDMDNWLKPEGITLSRKENFDRMSHHLARYFAAPTDLDRESNKDHLLHVACRALMGYVRNVKGIKHPKDVEGGN